eukprot:Amastigsp_a509549_94.p3 type:complete len:145 gc:universal Amastigsp_a509549_94:437-871(+)
MSCSASAICDATPVASFDPAAYMPAMDLSALRVFSVLTMFCLRAAISSRWLSLATRGLTLRLHAGHCGAQRSWNHRPARSIASTAGTICVHRSQARKSVSSAAMLSPLMPFIIVSSTESNSPKSTPARVAADLGARGPSSSAPR